MSEGSVYQRKDGRWVAKYKDIDGAWRYIYRKTRTEAKQALREALKDRDEGIIAPSKMTVADMLDEWLEEMKDSVSQRTWCNRESIVRCHIKQQLGGKKLSKLSPRDIRGLYRKKLAEGLSSATVKRVHVILNQAMREAVWSKYIIRSNPLDDVNPPKERHREMEVLSPEQVRALLDAARDDRLEAVYVLGATCALRVGECLSLRYEDIDFEEGALMVRRTLWRNKVYQPKTPHSRRTIKLPQIALESLTRLSERHGNPSEGWLFHTCNGNPTATEAFWRWGWKPMCRKAGLPTTLTYHQLRHSAASLLLSQKVPIPVVSRYLGHANPSITLSVYAHMIDSDDGLAGSAMDDLLGS